MENGKEKKTAKGADDMDTALLDIKNLSAWYSDRKKVLPSVIMPPFQAIRFKSAVTNSNISL